MLNYPEISPIAFHLGPLPVHWYGLMYLIGFAAAWGVTAWRARVDSWRGFTVEQISDLLFYIAVGVILGGRIGYMVFYDFPGLIHDPLRLFMIWQGGMSFHGGLLGVTIACWLFGRKMNKSFLEIGDLIAPAIPLGLATGRIGNFINGELWGRATDVPWAMVFPNAGPMARHPSQLYEFFLEGIVLFTVLWIFSRKPRPVGAVSGLFLVMYGCFRIFIEFFREPDPQLGYIAFGWLTQGQLLSIPMIIFGMFLITLGYHKSCKMCPSTKT